jgi:hypothetical protein
MEDSGEPLLTVPVHVRATCSIFWVYTWTSRHWKVMARRAVGTSDAADIMMQLHMKKKKLIAQQFCLAVQLIPLRETVIPNW